MQIVHRFGLIGFIAISLAACGTGPTVPLSATPRATPAVSADTCTIGYAETTVNVTVTGVGALSACQGLISSSASTPATYQTPAGDIVCSRSVGQITYVVREVEASHALGDLSCQALNAQT